MLFNWRGTLIADYWVKNKLRLIISHVLEVLALVLYLCLYSCFFPFFFFFLNLSYFGILRICKDNGVKICLFSQCTSNITNPKCVKSEYESLKVRVIDLYSSKFDSLIREWMFSASVKKIKGQIAERSKYWTNNQLSKLPTVFHPFAYSWGICKLPGNVNRKSNLDHVMQVCNCQHPQICTSKMTDIKGTLHLIATKWHIWGVRVNLSQSAV